MVEQKKTEVKVIKGGTVIDGTGAKPIQGASVVIEGSKIGAVGRDVAIPEAAQIIDAVGKTVMPGLIDSHLHFWGHNTGQQIEWVARPAEIRLIKSISDAKNVLASGFTTVKDCGGRNAVFLRNAAAEGILTGIPRIVAAGHPVSQTFGHGEMMVNFLPTDCVDARTSRLMGSPLSTLLCDGVDECIKAVRYTVREGADFIKCFVTGGPGPLSGVQFSKSEMEAIVQTAAQYGKFVTTHCEASPVAMKQAILGGTKTIDHAMVTDDECIELAMERGVIFVSTLETLRALGYGEHPEVAHAAARFKPYVGPMIESYKRIRKAGAVLAVGTDCTGRPSFKQGTNAIELEALVKYCDFTPMDAIVAATKNGAAACFMGDKTGTIEAGKLADIIVVDGNPLADIRILQNPDKIKMVMLDGEIEVNR